MIYIIIISIYFSLTLFVVIGFILHPYDHSSKSIVQIPISIIIAARNEGENIEKCLSGIASQNYPKELMEIVLIDDASNDDTVEKALVILQSSGIQHQLIRNEKCIGKKKSLKKAIEQSSFELIVTRDADTFTISNEWLSGIVEYQTTSKKEFIICPVAIEYDQTFLGALQEIETSILTLFTISSSFFKVPFLCSGANLVFTKRLFNQTNAYENHLHIPSGDDVFFLEAVKKLDNNLIGYLKNKDAVVYTYPEKDLKSLIQQKVRWSAKVFKSTSLINWLSALIIAITNFTWLWAVLYAVISPQNALISLFFALAKLLIDILLVFLAASFIKVRARRPLVLLMGCFYPLYASAITVLAPLMKPKWKNN